MKTNGQSEITMKIDPVRLLEAIGVDDYSIDYKNCSVAMPPREYMKVVDYFLKSQMSCEMEIGGWRLRKVE